MKSIQLKCISVKGLQQIFAYHGLQIQYDNVDAGLLAIVHKDKKIVYEETIKIDDRPLNKESLVYIQFREAYIKAQATKYLFSILREKGIITNRMPADVHHYVITKKQKA